MIRRLRDLRSDRGVTLVETLVVMVLSSLMISIAAVFFVSVTRQTMKAEDLQRSTSDASNIMNVVSTSIRAAVRNAVESSPAPDPAIVAADPRSVTVITYTDAGPSFEVPQRLRYRVDAAGRMIEDRWLATVDARGYAVFPSMSTTPEATRVLGFVVVNSAGEALFEYFDASGARVGAGSTLTSDQRAAVGSVRFHVKVRADGSEEVVELDNTIGMPNMGLGLTEEED